MAYMITSLPNDPEFLEFKKKFKQIDRGYYHNERMAPKHLQQNFWLLKPSNLNQGKGIEIFNNLKQLGLYLQGKPNDMQWIV
jgi:tubulin--tyrosine ligase